MKWEKPRLVNLDEQNLVFGTNCTVGDGGGNGQIGNNSCLHGPSAGVGCITGSSASSGCTTGTTASS